ncbi:hypothetical protein FNH22_19400 [Fulvivirga sp. M361]|uniref:hypothetical protein n=1 Tax=Fulvivirga sp. M361 TaxID=2594266 RepID=UPI00117A3C31|nr:hypothetical protein [Fulvivirga sp. M361]TRX54284.1 hypothetical protein FNH22_19400 [Fulvivirga sp. M361]
MPEELENHKQQVGSMLESHFLTAMDARFDAYASFLDQYFQYLGKLKKLQQQQNEVAKELRYIAMAKSEWLKSVGGYFKAFEVRTLHEEFAPFSKALHDYVQTFDMHLRRAQDMERFECQQSDGKAIKLGKWFKRLFYSISKWPEKMTNSFRRLFKKPVKPLKPWYHKIYFRRLSRFYLEEELFNRLVPQLSNYYLSLCDVSKGVWKLDEIIDHAFDQCISEEKKFQFQADWVSRFDQLKVDLARKKEEFRIAVRNVFETLFSDYAGAYVKAGTIELTNNRFNPRNLKKKRQRVIRKYDVLTKGWHNTLRVMSDDWEIDIELYSIIYAALAQFYVSDRKLRERIQGVIIPEFDRLNVLVQKHVNGINQTNAENLQAVLIAEHQSLLKGDLGKTAEEIGELILSQDIPDIVNEVEARMDHRINSISENRAVVNKFEYNMPLRSSSVNTISPYELINFESWPQFQKVARNVKVKTTTQISEILHQLTELDKIAEFNLASALSLFEEKDSKDDPRKIAFEGLQRTLQKLEEIRESFRKMQQGVGEDLYNAVELFNKSLVKFTNNENIFEIRVRIARAKAIEQSRALRDRVLEGIRNIFPTVARLSRIRYRKTTEFVHQVFKRYGISTESEAISTELADFLAETEHSINKLPFVYQRLFRAQPLEDENFYQTRPKEIRQLTTAYNNWMKKRFAASVVVGEKGSGLTTLFNFYLKELASSKEVIRISPASRVLRPNEIVAFFSKSLDQKFVSSADIVNYLNQGIKRVIIVENIQRLYLKKVHGFEGLKQLIRMISLTSKNVFWIVGCTQYAWDYLDKTLGLSDHFGYVVKLDEFDNEQMVDMIKRRHKVSGYNMVFEPSGINMNSKKFKKLSEEARQELLQKQYFNDLNKIAKGNASLALLYWLRSTSETSDNTISISCLRDIDFSFLKSYSPNKLYGLTQLLLHDGMSEDDFVQVTGRSSYDSRTVLHPLYEDGILVLENGFYCINPLLYRQVVTLLKSRNIIH